MRKDAAKALRDGLFDDFTLWDNNGNGKAIEIATLEDGKLELYKPKMWKRFLAKAKE